jgi:chemotaxis signal transduction protein
VPGDGAGGQGRFGVRLGGLPVVFPAGEMLEYLPEATIWALPLAPTHVAGLMQLRGHPVPVFDVRPAGSGAAPARAPVLVVGGVDAGPGRAAGLMVAAAPHGVTFAERRAASRRDAAVDEALDALAASLPFRAALAGPVSDHEGRRWWPVSPEALFRSLAGEAGDD